jgi:hypothetical protein
LALHALSSACISGESFYGFERSYRLLTASRRAWTRYCFTSEEGFLEGFSASIAGELSARLGD